MKLLFHICCAPCSVACVQSLRAEGIEPTGYWFNPNIHPFTEYRARRDTLKEYAAQIGLSLILKDTYGLRPFTRAVAEDIQGRCLVCYAARMRETARYAAENGFTHFTSTLFISPYQNHERLIAAAEQAAETYGVSFLYRDFRPVFRKGQEEARALGLYLQKYCGCVFSEEERFNKRFRHKTAPNRVENVETGDGLAEEERLTVAKLREAEALRLAGLRFEAAMAGETETPAVGAPGHGIPEPGAATVAASAGNASRTEMESLTDLTERALWETRNVLRCAADCELWDSPYCGAPVWRHAYHMLHSLDQWYINPMRYAEPPFHVPGLNDLDSAVNAPRLNPAEMEAYLEQIAARLRDALRRLTDAQLTELPEGSPWNRLALMVGQMRHLHTHMGMLMGFIIAEREQWPAVLGMKAALPLQDEGLPRYC